MRIVFSRHAFYGAKSWFENAGLNPLKTHQMFYMNITPQKIKNATITVHVRLFSEKNSGTGISSLSWRYRLRKKSLSKCHSPLLKRKVGVFTFLCFEECFRQKVLFSWRISVDDRNTANFSVPRSFSCSSLAILQKSPSLLGQSKLFF